MSYFVNTLSIRRWAETTIARSTLPHAVRQLVWGTIDRRHLQKVDFPAYESGQRPGFDGEVICAEGNVWVPTGHSVWELSVDANIASKATGDFKKRTVRTPADFRKEASYVCLSARFWKNKETWAEKQRNAGEWKDVRALDADDLEQWMEFAPGVASWFASQTGIPHEGLDDVASRWRGIAASTKRPLIPQVFLVSREETQKWLRDWLSGDPSELVIESRSPGEVLDFYCAALEVMEETGKLAFGSRSVIVESLRAWRILRDNCFPAVLVVDPSLELSAEEIGRAVTRGHHVLLAIEPRSLDTNNNALLERPSEFHLSQALEACGFSPVEAEQYARASGGSLAILKRKLARVPARNVTPWGDIASQPAIVSCLLLGGWDGGNTADRKVVETIAGRPYADLEPDFQRLATCRDPMLLHAAGNWRLLSKDEAWFVLGNRVTPFNLERFRAVAVEVLTDDDPRFELPDEERVYARIKGHAPKFSETLKTHIAQTIAFLGAFGDKLEAATHINVAVAMDRVVRDVLSPTATWHRWASLDASLPLLAEASPRSFLGAAREDLNRAEPELVKLFYEEGDHLFSSCNHAGLLWALETLAWSKPFLPEVCRTLLRLTEIDPRGRWANRPDATLREILCYWIPHTTANADELIKLLDMMIADRRETVWGILLKLLPEPVGGVSMPTRRPMWRDWANSWTRGAARGEMIRFITAVGERVIREVGNDAKRWKQVFENLARLPYTVHEQLISATEQFAQSDLSDADRRLVSDELSEQINRHRHFQDAGWSLPTEVLDALDAKLNRLKPRNCVLQHAWLFDRWPDRFYGRRAGTYQEHEQALEKARDEAVREIVHTLGFEGVESLVSHAEAPEIVGAAVARVSADQFISEVIPVHLSLGDKCLPFAGGFIWVRFRAAGWNWVEAATARCATDDQRAWLLVALPFAPETWQRAATAGDSVRRLYWQRCRAWNCDLAGDALRLAVESLVEHGLPANAVDMLAMAIHQNKATETATLLLVLEAFPQIDGDAAVEQIKRVGAHHIGELIEALQEREDLDLARLIRIEWNFLGILNEHSGRAPKTLHRHLCENPQFFVELLSLLYRSNHEQEDHDMTTAVDDERAAMATQGWRLLHDWKLLPGTQDDGSIDENALRTWCEKVRQLAADCGRLEVCDVRLGELFAHAPCDPDDKWPHASVRRVIESIATESIASGLHCGIRNSRGAICRGKGGDQERALAAKYRQQADQIRFDAPFTAEVLDSVADSYEREARDWDERDWWEKS